MSFLDLYWSLEHSFGKRWENGMAKRRGHGEGTVTYWEAKKLWVGKFTLPGGKRKTKYGKTQKEVKDWLLNVRKALGDGFLPETDKITLGEFLTRYLADYAEHAVQPATYESYSRLIRLHITPEIGAIKLAQLRPDHLNSFYAIKRKSGLSDRTVQYLHGLLHRSLKRALKWGLVNRNVADIADAPSNKKKPMTTWDRSQVRAFLESIKEDRWAALYALAFTGMRQGEILGLRWQDVDLVEGKLKVVQALSTVRGREKAFTQPKSDKSRRLIVLPEFVRLALRKHKREQDELRKLPIWQESGLVFTTNNGTSISPRNLVRHFTGKTEDAGLPHIRFHDMRHTAASLLLEGNVHPKVVQELLGHSQINLTLDTYSHVIPTMQKEAAKVMDGLVGQ